MLSVENSAPNSELIPQRQLCIPSKRTVPVTRARFEKARPNIKFSSKRTNEKTSRDKPAKEEDSKNVKDSINVTEKSTQLENTSNETNVTKNSLQSENVHDIAHATGKSLQSENVHDTADATGNSLESQIVNDTPAITEEPSQSQCNISSNDSAESISNTKIINDVLNTTEKSLQSEPISSAVTPERCKAINENDYDVDNSLLSTVETSALAQKATKNSTLNNSVSIPQKNNKTLAKRFSNTEISKKVNEERSENRYLPTEKECIPSVASSENRTVKYPHLTSILNSPKKRPENKEVLKKKRKYAYSIPKKGAAPPERSKMTMMDLIYYNPSSSPMQGKKTDDTSNFHHDELIEESNCTEGNGESTVQETLVHSTPLLILDENGEIDIEKSSLTVQRSIPEALSSETIRDDDTTYSSFRRRHSTWSIQETAKFYKALTLVGTDFGLMEKLLPNRTRRELKLKFKREEKLNLALVNKAMYESETFDIEALNDDNEIGSEFFESIEGMQNVIDCSASEVDTADHSRSERNEYIAKGKSLFTVNTPTENKQLLSDSSVAGDEKSNDSSVTGDEKLEEVTTMENGALRTGRKRKAKVLGDDFVDVDDVITEDDDVFCELQSSPVPPSKSPTRCVKPMNVKHKKQNYQKHDSLDEYNGDCTDLLNSSSQNVADTNDSAAFTVLSTCNSETTEEPCVISLNDSELDIVTNIVANEVVVESKKKNRRRNRQTPNVTEAQKRRKPVTNTNKTALPSSRIYTPDEEYPVYEEKHLKFSPEKNLRCYSHTKFLPNVQDLPVPLSQISVLNENECTVQSNSQDQALLLNLNTSDSVIASSNTDEINPGTGTAMIIVPSDQNIYTSNSVTASSNTNDSNPGTGTAMIIVPDDQNMYTSDSVTASSNTDDSNPGTGTAMIIVPNDQNMYHVYMYNKPTAPSITLSPESFTT